MTTEDFRKEAHMAVTDSVRAAAESLGIAKAIGDCYDAVNRSGRRRLIGHLQLSEIDRTVLNLAKLFDPPPRKYPTCSINGILALLEKEADALPCLDPRPIREFLKERGVRNADTLEGADLTRRFVEQYRSYLGHAGPSGESIEDVLSRLRFRRDKHIAHNEAVDEAEEVRASWADVSLVLGVAQDFLSLIGPPYMDFHFAANDGTYMLSKDHEFLGREMKRMMADLGIRCS
jgi:hypothetical protein